MYLWLRDKTLPSPNAKHTARQYNIVGIRATASNALRSDSNSLNCSAAYENKSKRNISIINVIYICEYIDTIERSPTIILALAKRTFKTNLARAIYI